MGNNGLAPTNRSIGDVWVEYKRTEAKTESLRNQLMEHYLPLVRYHAGLIHLKLPDEVELDDLISAGVFGLIDAIEAFDLTRGIKFETYCAPRIRGAILDEIRAMDWVPRLTRSRTRKITLAREELEKVLGREPTTDEMCKKLEVTLAEFEKMVNDSRVVATSSLSRKWFEADSNKDVREIDMLIDGQTEDPELRTNRDDLREAITRGLERTARLVICLYHFEGYRTKEIADMLFLSESRVSQIHDSAIKQIRSKRSLEALCKAG
jgi:RNA polymerase sigma factor for flagellar operon FliA